ncbi:hypothetical protein [Deinococcus roseus]|uniref:Uncharacterized protein n=1 Tax=Deinococcus roseus TaxID=392414 RepID=A0ABQ2DFU6_9DEIO|nr:hypothetical protein [Deinococcus roseus]GGJ55729.1 hypothetical protein GCM10008938_47400 [Deinococcus roseus]
MFIQWILEIVDHPANILPNPDPADQLQTLLFTFEYHRSAPANWSHPSPPQHAYFAGRLAQLHEHSQLTGTNRMRAIYRMDLTGLFKDLLSGPPQDLRNFTPHQLITAAQDFIHALQKEHLELIDHHPSMEYALPGVLAPERPF